MKKITIFIVVIFLLKKETLAGRKGSSLRGTFHLTTLLLIPKIGFMKNQCGQMKTEHSSLKSFCKMYMKSCTKRQWKYYVLCPSGWVSMNIRLTRCFAISPARLSG